MTNQQLPSKASHNKHLTQGDYSQTFVSNPRLSPKTKPPLPSYVQTFYCMIGKLLVFTSRSHRTFNRVNLHDLVVTKQSGRISYINFILHTGPILVVKLSPLCPIYVQTFCLKDAFTWYLSRYP